MNNNPQSRRLRELLNQLKSKHGPVEDDYEADADVEAVLYNSHVLYQEAAAQINAEQDIKIVREIALYYLDNICAVVPDHAATRIFHRLDGV